MIKDILALLLLFKGRVPDSETHKWVSDLATDPTLWPRAHDLFSQVRQRGLSTDKQNDAARATQYAFEEICLKSIFNETGSDAPFDSDAPYWIGKRAIFLARAIGVEERDVIDILAPREPKKR